MFNKEQIKYLEDFTSAKGLSHSGYVELCQLLNPCVTLLKNICNIFGHDREPPYTCPPCIKLFFRSIRKAVCPAISITPKILWGNLRTYLRSEASIDSLVSN